MKISHNFNRFYHAQIREFFLKAPNVLKIENIGTLYIKGLTFYSFKQFLKTINIDYPRDERGYPISTRDISSKELAQHIEFIFKLAGENGIELSVIKQEWENLIRRASEFMHI